MTSRRHRVAGWFAAALVGAIVAGCGDGASSMSSTAGGGSTPPPPPSGIGPAGGAASGPYGATLTVPAGALSNNVDIAVARDATGAPDLPASGVDTAGAPYALTPHGTPFAKAATVSVPYDDSRIPTDADPVLYKAEPGGAFAPIATTIASGMLVADITGLSWVIPGYASARPRVVYAVTGSTQISSFRIARGTGLASAATSTMATGQVPISVIVHPSRRFLLVTNAGSAAANGVAPNSLSVYRLDPVTGQIIGLVSTGPASSATPAAPPVNVVVHPNGRLVYVVNRDPFSSGANKSLSVFALDATTGALGAPLTTGADPGVTGLPGGAPPTAIAFAPSGNYAYVSYEFSIFAPVGDTFVDTVQTYQVDLATGALVGPLFSAPGGSHPWSVVVEPTGKFVFVASVSSDEVRRYSINASIGALTYLGSVQVQSEPSSLAVDPTGRFLYVAKEQPTFNMNLLVYRIANNGNLNFSSSVLTGSGAEVGQIAVTAEPQGQFVYAIDSNGTLLAYQIDAVNGILNPSGPPLPGFSFPWFLGGIGNPFAFSASGTSPVWQDGCSVQTAWDSGLWGPQPGSGCFFPGVIFGSFGGGGGGNSPPPPPPASSFALDATYGVWGGIITSAPAGIDYSSQPIDNRTAFTASFPAGSTVTLCARPPAVPQQVYDFSWTGSGGCSGAATCTNVRMSSNESCHLELTVKSP
jgi:6-phosphogluconolactonase (cycloisomerase 2 family)